MNVQISCQKHIPIKIYTDRHMLYIGILSRLPTRFPHYVPSPGHDQTKIPQGK